MENVNSRTTKGGRKIIASVKSFLVTTKIDIVFGKLNKRGEEGKLFSSVIPSKTIPAGEKFCLRFGVKKFNGNYLVYAHGFGWAEIENMEEAFTSKDTDFSSLLQNDYAKLNLSLNDKIQLFGKHLPEKFENLTKTERMLMAYLNDEDLNEVEKQISADKSLKYKIKKNPEKFEQTFVNKLELA